jgi:hypothetical protein
MSDMNLNGLLVEQGDPKQTGPSSRAVTGVGQRLNLDKNIQMQATAVCLPLS